MWMELFQGVVRIYWVDSPDNDDVLKRARVLAKRYRDSVADLVAVIAELDRCRAFERAGYSSLWDFCVKALGLSSDDAYKMINSARMARRRPEVLSYLADGSLTARSAALLAPESQAPDFPQLVERAKGRTVRQVEKLVASRHAVRPSKDSVKPVGARVAGGTSAETQSNVIYRVAFDADEHFKALLDRARDLLRHKFPAGRLEDVIREGIRLMLEQIDPLARAPTRSRLASRKNSRTRVPPPSVKDEVWRRDGGKCVFEGPDGRRCDSTTWLEIDHIVPWAVGGLSDDPSNLRLLCRAHNQSEAPRWFGGFG
jgi:hypothetical protein